MSVRSASYFGVCGPAAAGYVGVCDRCEEPSSEVVRNSVEEAEQDAAQCDCDLLDDEEYDPSDDLYDSYVDSQFDL